MSNQHSLTQALPGLERQVFKSVSQLGKATVALVAASLEAEGRPLAYTTVMTVLSRLYQKGYLLRQREGKAYLYSARPANDIAEGLAAQAALSSITRYGDLALSAFIQTLTAEQRELLSQLLQDHPGETTEGMAGD